MIRLQSQTLRPRILTRRDENLKIDLEVEGRSIHYFLERNMRNELRGIRVNVWTGTAIPNKATESSAPRLQARSGAARASLKKRRGYGPTPRLTGDEIAHAAR
jgi:hypothetical protein